MKTIFTILLLTILCQNDLFTQNAIDIFDKYINATGGKSFIESFESIKLTYGITESKFTRTYNYYFKTPNLQRIEEIRFSDNKYILAYDGEKFWTSNINNSGYSYIDNEVKPSYDLFRYYNVIFKMIDFNNQGYSLSYNGIIKYGKKKKVYSIVFAKDNESIEYQIDSASSLLYKSIYKQGIVTEEVTYTNYKTYYGYQLPCTHNITSVQGKRIISITNFEINPVIEDDLFTLPEVRISEIKDKIPEQDMQSFNDEESINRRNKENIISDNIISPEISLTPEYIVTEYYLNKPRAEKLFNSYVGKHIQLTGVVGNIEKVGQYIEIHFLIDNKDANIFCFFETINSDFLWDLNRGEQITLIGVLKSTIEPALLGNLKVNLEIEKVNDVVLKTFSNEYTNINLRFTTEELVNNYIFDKNFIQKNLGKTVEVSGEIYQYGKDIWTGKYLIQFAPISPEPPDNRKNKNELPIAYGVYWVYANFVSDQSSQDIESKSRKINGIMTNKEITVVGILDYDKAKTLFINDAYLK
jgi:hypothetical protein